MPASRLDHILYVAPDMEKGLTELDSLLGVEPIYSGRHPGNGTRNALMSLGDDVYLELLVPDPEQSLEGNLGGRLAALNRTGLYTWCISNPDLNGLARSCPAGMRPVGPRAMARILPTGGEVHWQLLFLPEHAFGLTVPFVIDWGTSPHPSRTLPRLCSLRRFTVLGPDPQALGAALAALGSDQPVARAPQLGLELCLKTPKGEVVLHSLSPLPDRLV